ncbi:hypothetical protein GGQ54_000906 [Naumannella cuiyingiana]|uniref:Uncharacterized protein n=1 Tax=Naumannella cuiyingiana TaxID=1347891 RepID=A0A7Z0D7J6_9ACTN|nr:hypothetical protein [Naumannella cuiyingiana]NYI70346.1 hypothetical protein [Naumannella cuiyingiana]
MALAVLMITLAAGPMAVGAPTDETPPPSAQPTEERANSYGYSDVELDIRTKDERESNSSNAQTNGTGSVGRGPAPDPWAGFSKEEREVAEQTGGVPSANGNGEMVHLSVCLDDPTVSVLCPNYPGGGDGAPPAPTIAPEEAARRAVAKIRLTAKPPGLSPDWNKNKYKMLAVGFPVWVHADPDSLTPVNDSQNIEGLGVSLDAAKPNIAVKMGDGTTLRCALKGRPFNHRDEPGSDGPCSHRYQKMSPPDGYTVTAIYTWDVAWTAGGQSGVITVSNQASTQIPIGELQALITAPR